MDRPKKQYVDECLRIVSEKWTRADELDQVLAAEVLAQRAIIERVRALLVDRWPDDELQRWRTVDSNDVWFKAIKKALGDA